MQNFFRSNLYRNFWLFILKGALTVGVTSGIGMAVVQAFSPLIGSADIRQLLSLFILVFLTGFATGFLVASSAFWILYILLKANPKLPLTKISLGFGALSGAFVLWYFCRDPYFRGPNAYSLLLSLLIPYLVSVFVFVRLTQKHLNESARSIA